MTKIRINSVSDRNLSIMLNEANRFEKTGEINEGGKLYALGMAIGNAAKVEMKEALGMVVDNLRCTAADRWLQGLDQKESSLESEVAVIRKNTNMHVLMASR